MAYITSVTTSSAANTSPQTPAFPPHAVGDLLLCCVTQDGGGTTIATSSTGWTVIAGQDSSGGTNQAWAWKIATGTSGEDPSFTGAADEWTFCMLIVKDAHATQPFGAAPASGTDYVRTNWSAVGSANSGSLTPAVDNCLLIYSTSVDTAGTSSVTARCSPNQITVDSRYVQSLTGTVGHVVGHIQAGPVAAAPTVTFYNNEATRNGHTWILAVRNKASGILQPDCRGGADIFKYFGDFGVASDGITWASPDAITAAGTVTIDGVACSTNTATRANAADAPNPPGNYTQFASTESTSGAWVGASHQITSTDMSGKVFGIQWRVPSLNSARIGSKGWIVVFSDGTNWAAYQLSSLVATTAVDTAFFNQIALGAATALATSGSINWAAVTRVGYMWHRIGSSATSGEFLIKNAVLMSAAKFIGGGSGNAATWKYLPNLMAGNGHLNLANLQGSAQTLGKGLMQIGDGATTTYFDASASSFEYPLAFDATSETLKYWNANTSSVGINIKASASDTINLTACVIATATAQPFTIDAASSLSALYSFIGASIVGYTVTDNAGLTWNSTTFKSGGIVTIAGGGDLTNCTITKTTSSNAALAITANGSVITSSTIDCTKSDGTFASYCLELGTAVTAVTLADVTFSGTPGADKVHVLKTTGTVTITISGTTSLAAGDVTSAGATVVISAPALYQSVTVSGFTAGSRVQIYDTTSSTELFNGTATAGNTVVSGTTATWTDPNPAASSRAIRVRVSYVSGATAKNFIESSGLTCGVLSTNVSVTYPVSPTNDTTYNSNAIDGPSIYATSGITFTDASPDRVNCNIGGGSVTYPTIYACFVYWNFTSTGIANDFTYIDAPDTANYILSGMKIRNTSSVDLSVTGGYGRDATTGTSAAIIDTAGSTGNIFLAPDHVVAYATGSGVTAQNITDIAAASATSTTSAVFAQASTTPIHSDIRKVNSVSVTGTGQVANPWGPA